MTAAVSGQQAAAVAGGAALGALARWGAGLLLNPVWGGFPLGTWLVNCLGGGLIGVAMVWFARSPDEFLRTLLVTGLLGGFTTFSTFSYETSMLLISGSWLAAGLNVLASVGVGLVGVFLGSGLIRLIA